MMMMMMMMMAMMAIVRRPTYRLERLERGL